MNAAKQELVKSWLTKAQHDLASAKNSIGPSKQRRISMPSFYRYCLQKFTHDSQKHRNPERPDQYSMMRTAMLISHA